MKKILIAALILSGCATTKTYRVTAYAQVQGMYEIEAVQEGKRKPKYFYFVTDCPPDSVGSRFNASRKDWQVQRPRH